MRHDQHLRVPLATLSGTSHTGKLGVLTLCMQGGGVLVIRSLSVGFSVCVCERTCVWRSGARWAFRRSRGVLVEAFLIHVTFVVAALLSRAGPVLYLCDTHAKSEAKNARWPA